MSAPFEIQGQTGEPVAIKPGEYYFNTKARCRRMMSNSLSSEARQIYACLELATMGFQQEEAVTKASGKARRPLTLTDVADQTKLKKQNINRGFAELEASGLAERRSDDGGPLRKGHIRLYSWAEPRAGSSENGNRARLPFPDWFPESWEPLKPLIRRLKLVSNLNEVVARDYLEEGSQIAHDYQNLEKVIEEFLERVCAQAPIYKEERTERTERTVSDSVLEDESESSSSSFEPPEPATTTNTPDSESAPPANEPTGTPEAPNQEDLENAAIAAVSAYSQTAGVRHPFTLERQFAAGFLRQITQEVPDLTTAELDHFITEKLTILNRTGHVQMPASWLRKVLVEVITPESVRDLRRRHAAPPAKPMVDQREFEPEPPQERIQFLTEEMRKLRAKDPYHFRLEFIKREIAELRKQLPERGPR